MVRKFKLARVIIRFLRMNFFINLNCVAHPQKSIDDDEKFMKDKTFLQNLIFYTSFIPDKSSLIQWCLS